MGRAKVSVIIVVAVVALCAWLVLRSVGVVPGREREVVVVGDSISAMSQGTFTEKLGDRWNVTTSAHSGDRTDQRVADLPDLASHRPVQVVINLGTNDVLQQKPVVESVGNIEKLGSGIPGVRCVHLVTINERMFKPDDLGLHDRTAELNAGIQELATRHHGWDVVPWDAIVRDYDQGPQPYGPLTFDTVHPTEAGMRVLADAYGRALDSC